MKTKFILSLLLLLTASFAVKAQTFTTATDALLFFEVQAQEIVEITDVQMRRLNPVRNTLQNGNANLLNKRIGDLIAGQDRVEELSDELNTGSSQAAQLDPNASNAFLLSVGATIEGLQDDVVNNLLAAQAAINQGDSAGALSAFDAAVTALQQQNALATQAIATSQNVRASL